MICHIVQNGGYIILILLFCLNKPINTAEEFYSFSVQEYCSGSKSLPNIEPGSDLKLHLNSGSSARINKWFHKSKRKCRKEFRTSSSAAHLEVHTNISKPTTCDDCRCNYFEIWTLHGHSKRFCGIGNEYISFKTDVIAIDFHPSLYQPFDVTFTFSAKRNLYPLSSTSNAVSSIFVETPYFPAKYPPLYKVNYVLKCDDKSHVMFLFLDFQVSSQSFIEVVGANSTHPERFYGHVFRPPVAVSESYTLNLEFQSNNQEGMPGFRAEFSCIKSKDSLFVPFTDCGGLLTAREGLLNIKTHKGFALYDCVWHITNSVSFSTRSFRSVFVHIKNISSKSSLVFKRGYHSKSEIVKDIVCEKQNCTSVDEEVKVVASDYLYIRFRGYLDELSSVNMSYSTYHLENCSSSEFRCTDNRCLKSDFRCDGVKQCPDGLDEHTCPSSQVSGDKIPSHPSAKLEPMILTPKIIFIIFLLFGIVASVLIVMIFIFTKNCKQVGAGDHPLPQPVDELMELPSVLYPIISSHDSDNPPTYEDYMKSSDNYPPILFIRACQRSDNNDTHCTTSFCNGARVRHHSADTFNIGSSGSDIFLNITGENSNPTQQSSLSDGCNIEINQRITFGSCYNNLKRSHSLDSKLSNHAKKDCNFSLSVIHPVCDHMSNHQCYTLPSNFKQNEFKTEAKKELKRPTSLQLDSHVTFPRDRHLTWSFSSHRSFGPEIVTTVKTRCFSEPCNGISVHCSLY